MKKILSFILSFTVSTIIANAQLSIGPKIGCGLATYSVIKTPNGIVNPAYSSIITPQFGAVLNFEINDNFSLRPE